LETIPKVGVLFQADQRVQGDDDQPPPCFLTEGEIVKWVSKIQLGPNLHLKERKQYEDLLHKYIHMFTFSYKDFKEVTMEQHKIELLPNAKPIKTKQGRWNPKYTAMMKEKFDKLLEARFVRPIETTECVSPVVLALKENHKLKICVNYKSLNKIIKKDHYPLPFCEEILEEVAGHEMYTFGTFCYIIMPFGLCIIPKTFQCLMNKVFEPFLGLFLRVFIDDFGVYNDRAFHLTNLS
jgi:hypothetical protein